MRITFKLSIILIIATAIANTSLAAHGKNNHSLSKKTQHDNTHHLAANYKQVFEELKKNNWANAENLAKQMHDRALLKIIISQKFLSTNSKAADFNIIINFLKQNPKWPQNEALKTKAEEAINCTTDKRQIYNWFKNNPPTTGNGHKYYAQAAAQIEKDPNILSRLIKNGWIYGCFGKDEQASYYNKFKKYLTTQDNVNRVDNLFWKGSTKSAKDSLNLVPTGYRKSFEVQMAFLNNKADAKKLFTTIPNGYYTPGLIYQYISSRKSDLPSAKEIVSLINLVKHSRGHENDFWKVQCYLAREYIQNKRFNDAYIVASSHFATSPASVSDAEFLSGWLALRFLNKPGVAIKHFNNFKKVVKTPMSIARGLYWLGRASTANGDSAGAQKFYKHAAHKFGYTFYGQVATMELGGSKLMLPPKVTLAKYKNDQYTKNNDILKAAKLTSKYANKALARIYLDALVNSADEEEEILAIALEMESINLHHKVWMSKGAIGKHVFIDHYSFPVPYKTKGLPTEEALTYSIIRQESVFDQHAKSTANAMGLMQLIESTACETAKKIALKCNVKGLINNPNYNLTLGSNHLAEVIQKYQNSYILAMAAYNGGPGNVNKWIKLYGDPRRLKDHHKIIDWIEIIPFAETRNYVQRVLENLQIYRTILHKDGKFKLRQDLGLHG